MSGRITTPAPGLVAGSAYAAEKRVPSAAVRVVNPRSATSPLRGGAGGRLSWSWHMGRFYRPAPRRARRAVAPGRRSVAGGLARGFRPAAEDAGRHLATCLRQPLVLPVGLVDQPLHQPGIDTAIDLGDLAQGLETGPLEQDGVGDELELDQIAER